MVQNRNKLIDLFIGKISDVVVHKISNKAIDDENLSKRYLKEIKTSLDKAGFYREKINPINRPLPNKDIEYIKTKIITKVKSELSIRISKGYKNINLDGIEELVDKTLKNMKII